LTEAAEYSAAFADIYEAAHAWATDRARATGDTEWLTSLAIHHLACLICRVRGEAYPCEPAVAIWMRSRPHE
jgi:hypothetical protein